MGRPEKVMNATEQAQTKLYVLEHQLSMERLHDAKATMHSIDLIRFMRKEGNDLSEIREFVSANSLQQEVIDRVNQVLMLQPSQYDAVYKGCSDIVDGGDAE